jgi:formylmethanofuran dehydrogenase subunit E
MTYEEIIQFHGHECPGLAIGYRMATAAMQNLESFPAEDEELVAIVENDACGVDALQCVTGCTFGKGNLQFRDYGKHVYTIYSRSSRSGVRVHFHGNDIPESLREDRKALTSWLLSASNDSILSVTQTSPCAFCGENVMESRIQQLRKKPACIPCYEKLRKFNQNGEAGIDNSRL